MEAVFERVLDCDGEPEMVSVALGVPLLDGVAVSLGVQAAEAVSLPVRLFVCETEAEPLELGVALDDID